MLNRRSVLSALSTLACAFSARPAEAAQDGENLLTYDINELIAERAQSGRPYLPFLDRSTLRCGLYVLAANSQDRQSPHETDEVYYVLSGRGSVWVEGETRPVATGSVVYVKAQAEHRFIDIQEELQLLVFFD